MTQLLGDGPQVALLVDYVRSQMQLLDKLETEDLLKGEFLWRPPVMDPNDLAK